MALPTKKTLTRGKTSVRNEKLERVLVDETDSELAFRQGLHDSYIDNYIINKINSFNSMIDDVHKSFDWTQLVDTTLTTESQAEFTTYRANLKKIGKNYFNAKNEPLDVNDNFWDENFPMGSLISEPPTPAYKPEE
jgi:hypothetical protein